MFPIISRCKLGIIVHLYIHSNDGSCIELLKICYDTLVYGLEMTCCIRWKEICFYETKDVCEIIPQTWRVYYTTIHH